LAEVILVATMTVRREAIDEFRSFENQAAGIMAKHGGIIERTVVVDSGSGPLQEIHIVTFPSEQALAAYQADDGLRKLARLREQSVIKTEIIRGEAGPDYRPEALA